MKKETKQKTAKVIESLASFMAITIALSSFLFIIVCYIYPAVLGLVSPAFLVGWMGTGLAIGFFLDRPTL